jgi:hypothetical protein
VELFDYSLWAAPVGLAIATVELISHRRLLPLLLGLAGVPLGGIIGRVAWELFADPPPGVRLRLGIRGLRLGDRLRVHWRTHRRPRRGLAFHEETASGPRPAGFSVVRRLSVYAQGTFGGIHLTGLR